MLVIAILVALYIGIPIDIVSLMFTYISFMHDFEEGMQMSKCNDTVGSGAHGAA